MKPLDPEMHRVLLKRIVRALEKAKYEPAKVLDIETAAREVLRPYEPKPFITQKGPTS